jgi:two-component system chemotaxis response regulator CheB
MTQDGDVKQRDEADRPVVPAGSARQPSERIRILVVDGSPLMRRLLTRILETDSGLEVVGAARSVADALARFEFFRPDLVLLDAEVRSKEESAALGELEELYAHIPAVKRVEIDDRCARLTMEALQDPAAPISAPADSRSFDNSCSGEQFAADLLKQVWRAAPQSGAKSKASPRQTTARMAEPMSARRTHPVSPARYTSPRASYPQALVIGSSTGGPAALSTMLSALPPNFALPILIVQHMPPSFTKMLADRLTKTCCVPFVEAEDGMEVLPGRGYIAPGGFHMGVTRKLKHVTIQLSEGDLENSCRPAVDFLFRSVAEAYLNASIAVVLTGMGQDGLRGVRALKEKGVPIFVQDRESSVVWGMPGAIAEAGLADDVLPITEIAPKILRLL